MRRISLALATSLGLIASLLSPTSATAAYTCSPTKALTQYTSKKVTTLGSGVELGEINFDPGVANSGWLNTKFSWAKGSLSRVNFLAAQAPTGETASQYKLAADFGAQAYINTDYYNEGTRFPYSAVMRGGALTYAPNHPTNVVAMAEQPYTLATGYPGSSSLKSGLTVVVVTGVNTGELSAASVATVITPEYLPKALPAHQAALWVDGGRVVKVYAKGATYKVKTGLLVVAKGAHANRIRTLKVGAKVSYKLAPMPSPRRVMVSDRVWAAGKVSTAGVSLSIRSVNSDSLSPEANLYDSNYSRNRGTVEGRYTLVVNAAGKLQSKYWGGSPMAVPVGSKVIQLGNDGLALYKAAVVGADVSIENSYATRSGLKLLEASGRGGDLLSKGMTIQVCYPRTEEVRPRTAIGWNNKTGEVWIATASSGNFLGDPGFRMGGSTIRHMTDWLRQLGATDAVTVDGGGSTTFMARLDGAIHRIDLPDQAWIREVPVGVALSPK
jgi:hypothetical protein